MVEIIGFTEAGYWHLNIHSSRRKIFVKESAFCDYVKIQGQEQYESQKMCQQVRISESLTHRHRQHSSSNHCHTRAQQCIIIEHRLTNGTTVLPSSA